MVGSISRFEDIEAWQDARVLVKAIYEGSTGTPLERDFGLKDQVRRAAVSIMANIAEGFGRHRRQELIHFLHIASGSCAELQSHLYVALDNKLIEENAFNDLSEQTDKVGRKLTAFRQYLQRTKAKAAVKEDQAVYVVNDEAIER